jgi:hypothetical protein
MEEKEGGENRERSKKKKKGRGDPREGREREMEDKGEQEVGREQGLVRIGGERKEGGLERRMYVHIHIVRQYMGVGGLVTWRQL